MAVIDIASLPIRDIRESFSGGFAAWDRSVARNDGKGAREARKEMQAAALALLPKPVTDLAGWYVFADLDADVDIGSVRYIGIAKTTRRPIGRRVVDRFRDDSCLDVKLDNLCEAEQRRIVERRLRVALPRSGVNYVSKHMAASRLIRQSTHILMIGTQDTISVIQEVERLLINAAVEAGNELSNIHHRRFRGTVSELAVVRAHEVLSKFGVLNLPPRSIDRLRSRLIGPSGKNRIAASVIHAQPPR